MTMTPHYFQEQHQVDREVIELRHFGRLMR